MKIAGIISALLFGLFIVFLFVSGKESKTGHAPGLIDLSLARCADKPNCVCSEYKDDTAHYIEPVIIPNKPDLDFLLLVKTTIRNMGGIPFVHTDNYIAAIFSSTTFGFVDDLEVRADLENSVLHIRSASRVGYSDAGVNKRRVELFKKKLSENLLVEK
ncbi:DUF1499 domain-containing protein [Gammaproteobacteria bacterium AH-315-C21]|nr:DUF1499 domain-containing protein [Gammaproteobacteria bacterium AH-315-C21]